MRYGIIYKITSPSGKVYIGQTIRLKERIRQYRNNYVFNQTKVYRSIRKYGFENHLMEVLEICPEFMLNVLEAHYMTEYDSIKNGLNISSEPYGYITDEQKEQIRKTLTGRKASEETKKKMSISHKGRGKGIKKNYKSPKHSQMIPVVRISKEGEEKVYESLLSVEKDGFESVNVGRICKGGYGRYTHKGFNWKYLNKVA